MHTSWIFHGIVALAIALSSIGAMARDDEVEKALRSMSREMNKSLPLQIDKEKLLEATVVMQSTLIFKYKFTDETVINDPRFDKNRYVAHLQVSLGESTCKDAGAFELLRRGAIYNYIFINRRGVKIIDFKVNAKFCSQYRRRAGVR